MQLPAEQVIVVDGVQYRLSKFTLDLYHEFLDWSKTVLPDPFEGLAERIKNLSPELQKYAYDKAEARAEIRGTTADPEIQKLLTTDVRGIKKVVHLLLRKYQPHLSEDQAMEVVQKGVAEHGEDFFSRCFPQGDGDTDGRPAGDPATVPHRSRKVELTTK